MSLLINLRHLEKRNLAFKGGLDAAELDLDSRDEMVRAGAELRYDFEAQKLDDSLLLRGRLRLPLACRCVRCLKSFRRPLDLPDWTCHVPLSGEDAARVAGDCLDLTPWIREDILLAFPQHPLCDPHCCGVAKSSAGGTNKTGGTQTASSASAWAALDKLKL